MLSRCTTSRWAAWDTIGSEDSMMMWSHTPDSVLHCKKREKWVVVGLRERKRKKRRVCAALQDNQTAPGKSQSVSVHSLHKVLRKHLIWINLIYCLLPLWWNAFRAVMYEYRWIHTDTVIHSVFMFIFECNTSCLQTRHYVSEMVTLQEGTKCVCFCRLM